jgi:hypothetical protein
MGIYCIVLAATENKYGTRDHGPRVLIPCNYFPDFLMIYFINEQ